MHTLRIAVMVLAALHLSGAALAHRSLKAPPKGHLKDPSRWSQRRHMRINSKQFNAGFMPSIQKIAVKEGWIPARGPKNHRAIRVVSAYYHWRNYPHSKHHRTDNLLIEVPGGDVHVARMRRLDRPTSPIGPWKQYYRLSGLGARGIVSQADAQLLVQKHAGNTNLMLKRRGLQGSSYLFSANNNTNYLVDVWTGVVKEK